MQYKLLFSVLVISFMSCSTPEHNPKKDHQKRYEEKLYPFEGYYDQKNYPETSFDYKLYFESLRSAGQSAAKNKSTGNWILQGPGNIGGRVNVIKVDPSNDQIIYLGYSQGGIWKTVDGGSNWNPVFDDQAYLSISTIELDPTDPNIIYAGTGDLNISGYPFIGDGIYKSVDGGINWDYIGLRDQSITSKVIVSKQNSDVIYAATMGIPFERNNSRGLYKTTNGGQLWEQVLFLNDSTGIIDLIIDPTDDKIVFAVSWNRIRNDKESLISGPDAGIHKSVDGGATWQKLGNGLPTGRMSRAGITRFGAGTDTLIAMFTATGGSLDCNTSSTDLLGIYRSFDAGDSWSQIPTGEVNGLPCSSLGGFAWYFGKIAVNPNDHNDIFLLGVDLWRTRNGGESWIEAAPPWFFYDVHADKHDLVFENGIMYLGTDGGAYSSNINDEIWTDIENIPSTQFYRVAVNPFLTDQYYGGAQDNGSTGGNNTNINDWPRIFGGDGFQMSFNPNNPNIFTTETQRGNINITYDGGFSYASITDDMTGTRNWDMPYFMRTSNPMQIITGSDKVYLIDTSDPYFSVSVEISPVLVDPDPTAAFSQNISTVGESKLDPAILMAGTSDGLVWITKDEGVNWTNVDQGLPRRYVSHVTGSTIDRDVFYVSFTGYKSNDFTPLLYKSIDGGTSWQSIAGDLPLLSINNFEIIPGFDDKVIFVATDGGVFYTDDGGTEWLRLGDMPVIPVYDIVYNEDLNQVVAGTFARGIMSYDIDQLGLTVSSNDPLVENISFKVYPTLADEYITIEFEETQSNLNMEILDFTGKIYLNKKLFANKSKIDVSTLSAGNYIARISGKSISATQKFVVAK